MKLCLNSEKKTMAGYSDPPKNQGGRPPGSTNKAGKYFSVREELAKRGFNPLHELINLVTTDITDRERIDILKFLCEYSCPKLKPIESDPEVAAQERSLITMSRDDLIMIARGKSDEV